MTAGQRGDGAGVDLDAIERSANIGLTPDEARWVFAEVRRLRDLVGEFRKRDESQDRIRTRLTEDLAAANERAETAERERDELQAPERLVKAAADLARANPLLDPQTALAMLRNAARADW